MVLGCISNRIPIESICNLNGVKTKTSISLSSILLEEVDQRAKQCKQTRSDYMEKALTEYLRVQARAEEDTRDREIIAQRHEFLN